MMYLVATVRKSKIPIVTMAAAYGLMCILVPIGSAILHAVHSTCLLHVVLVHVPHVFRHHMSHSSGSLHVTMRDQLDPALRIGGGSW